jgi:hypothetical protein
VLATRSLGYGKQRGGCNLMVQFQPEPIGKNAGQCLLICKAAFQKPPKMPIWMIIRGNFASDFAEAGLLPPASLC